MEGPPLRKIIFYSTTGPDRDDAAWVAFSLARHAIEADLDVEIFLAGAATGLMRKEVRGRIEGRPLESFTMVTEAKVPISLAPG